MFLYDETKNNKNLKLVLENLKIGKMFAQSVAKMW